MLEQLKQAAQEVATHRATDAAVAHFDDFLIRRDKQVMIDTDAEQHQRSLKCDFRPVFGGEYAV